LFFFFIIFSFWGGGFLKFGIQKEGFMSFYLPFFGGGKGPKKIKISGKKPKRGGGFLLLGKKEKKIPPMGPKKKNLGGAKLKQNRKKIAFFYF